jgi:hypothetical protein
MSEDLKINTTIKDLTQKELELFYKHGKEQYPGKYIEEMTIEEDGDYVNIKYGFKTIPFQRIRRITGYLVGTTERFNDAKRCEVEDRVTHTI